MVRACSTKSGSRSLQPRQSGEKKPSMVSPRLSRVIRSPAVVTAENPGTAEPARVTRPSTTLSDFSSAWARSLRMTPKVSSSIDDRHPPRRGHAAAPRTPHPAPRREHRQIRSAAEQRLATAQRELHQLSRQVRRDLRADRTDQ